MSNVTRQWQNVHAIKAYWKARQDIRENPKLADRIVKLYSRLYRRQVTYIRYLQEIASEVNTQPIPETLAA